MPWDLTWKKLKMKISSSLHAPGLKREKDYGENFLELKITKEIITT